MPQSYLPGVPIYLAAVGDTKHPPSGVPGSNATLDKVVVNTKAASAVLTIYDGTSTTGTKVATLDCASLSPASVSYGIRCHNGVYAVMTGGNADVTIVVI